MIDEIPAILAFAGPDEWHHLIAPTRTNLTTQGAATLVGSALGACSGPRSDTLNITTLTELAAASIIISNKIANTLFTISALAVFEEARRTARILKNNTPTRHPAFNRPFIRSTAMLKVVRSEDPAVLTWLLVDIIRVADHIVDYA